MITVDYCTTSETSTLVVRPWGTFETLHEAQDHKVKRIVVFPGKRLSLQRHKYRAEHWYIIHGRGLATVGDKKFPVGPGHTVDVPHEQTHRIENTGNDDLVFIEIQTGTYFGEDDIERLEDDYGRV